MVGLYVIHHKNHIFCPVSLIGLYMHFYVPGKFLSIPDTPSVTAIILMARIGSTGGVVSSRQFNSPMNVDRINQVPVALFGRIAMPSTLLYWIPESRILMRLRQFRQAQKKSVGQYFADKRKPAADRHFIRLRKQSHSGL